MTLYNIDPVKMTDKSVYDYTNFADNQILRQLREEYAAKGRLKKRKDKPPPKQGVIYEPRKIIPSDHDIIRALYNEGLKQSAIAKKLGYTAKQINNMKYLHIYKVKDWVCDAQGKLQWAVKTELVA